MKKVIESQIKVGRYENEVWNTYDDGSRQRDITYYNDELYFSSEEFIGKTEEEVMKLYFRKDREYLRS